VAGLERVQSQIHNVKRPNNRSTAQRWIGLGLAFVVILTLAGAAILALRNNHSDNAGNVDRFQAVVAAKGVNMTDTETDCVLDVVDDYTPVDQYLERFGDGRETDLDEERFALDILDECPTVVSKMFDADDSGEYDAGDLDTAAHEPDESSTPTTTPPPPAPPAPPTTEPPATQTDVPPDQMDIPEEALGVNSLRRSRSPLVCR
jgi:hypothetical protein